MRSPVKTLPLESTFKHRKSEQKITISGSGRGASFRGKRRESELVKKVKEFKKLMLIEESRGRGKLCCRIFRRIFAG